MEIDLEALQSALGHLRRLVDDAEQLRDLRRISASERALDRALAFARQLNDPLRW